MAILSREEYRLLLQNKHEGFFSNSSSDLKIFYYANNTIAFCNIFV